MKKLSVLIQIIMVLVYGFFPVPFYSMEERAISTEKEFKKFILKKASALNVLSIHRYNVKGPIACIGLDGTLTIDNKEVVAKEKSLISILKFSGFQWSPWANMFSAIVPAQEGSIVPFVCIGLFNKDLRQWIVDQGRVHENVMHALQWTTKGMLVNCWSYGLCLVTKEGESFDEGQKIARYPSLTDGYYPWSVDNKCKYIAKVDAGDNNIFLAYEKTAGKWVVSKTQKTDLVHITWGSSVPGSFCGIVKTTGTENADKRFCSGSYDTTTDEIAIKIIQLEYNSGVDIYAQDPSGNSVMVGTKDGSIYHVFTELPQEWRLVWKADEKTLNKQKEVIVHKSGLRSKSWREYYTFEDFIWSNSGNHFIFTIGKTLFRGSFKDGTLNNIQCLDMCKLAETGLETITSSDYELRDIFRSDDAFLDFEVFGRGIEGRKVICGETTPGS